MILGKPSAVTIYAYYEPVDMREGFEGQAGVVRNAMGKDRLSGALFLFAHRHRTRAKALCSMARGCAFTQSDGSRGDSRSCGDGRRTSGWC